MNIIKIKENEILNEFKKREIDGNCIINKYDDNTLFKIYKKDFINTYKNGDLEKDISNLNNINNVMLLNNENISQNKLNRLLLLADKLHESKSPLIKGIVIYQSNVVGILIEYYKNYKILSELNINRKERIKVLKQLEKLYNNLLEYKIFPMKLNEDNIMYNGSDIKLIGLDKSDTKIATLKLLKKDQYLEINCDKNFNQLRNKIKTLSKR